MELIKPKPTINILLRKHQASSLSVISELGIYGVFISDNGVCNMNKEGGFLLRTKTVESNEGGVAAGFAVLDSPYLV
jgi:glutathione synthase